MVEDITQWLKKKKITSSKILLLFVEKYCKKKKKFRNVMATTVEKIFKKIPPVLMIAENIYVLSPILVCQWR